MIRSFVRVPRSLIDSGVLAEQQGAVARAWLLALCWAGTGRSANDLKRELVQLGMHKRTAEKSIAKLVTIGCKTD